MRHRVSGRALGRTSSHRKALIRNQITDLLRHDRIVTTEAKAKTVRPAAEKVITLGKRGNLHARRQAGAILTDKKVLKRLFDDIAPRFESRRGGYTRIVKLGPRQGDGAHMALIELVDAPVRAAAPEAPAAAEAPAATTVDDTAADDTATDDTAAGLVADEAPDEDTSEDEAETVDEVVAEPSETDEAEADEAPDNDAANDSLADDDSADASEPESETEDKAAEGEKA